MPIPLALALGLTAAGTGLQFLGNRQRSKAQNAALDAYYRDLDRIDQRGQGFFEESLNQQREADPRETVNDEAEQVRQQVRALVAENPFDPSSSPSRAGAPRVVQEEAGRQLADELARARGRISAAAQLQGFGTRHFNRGIQLSRSDEQFRLLQPQARGVQNVFNVARGEAENAGQFARTLGTLLTTVGGSSLGASAGGGTAGAQSSRIPISSIPF